MSKNITYMLFPFWDICKTVNNFKCQKQSNYGGFYNVKLPKCLLTSPSLQVKCKNIILENWAIVSLEKIIRNPKQCSQMCNLKTRFILFLVEIFALRKMKTDRGSTNFGTLTAGSTGHLKKGCSIIAVLNK